MDILKVETRRGDFNKKTRVYFFHEGETILENLADRRRRPNFFYRKMLPEVYEKVGVSEGVKASWSQKAGCSCGCSPGFILSEKGCRDIFVTVRGKMVM